MSAPARRPWLAQSIATARPGAAAAAPLNLTGPGDRPGLRRWGPAGPLPPAVGPSFPPAPRGRFQPLRSLALLLSLLLTVLLIDLPSLAPLQPLLALSDAQAEVVEAWRLVNQSYVDPSRLEAIDWRRQRQKTLERPIETSEQAYDAIEDLLAAIGDPYTRLLRPADYDALRSSTRGTLSGVGLQLALRGDGGPSGQDEERQRIVVIAPLDGSPAAEAGIPSGSEVLRVDGRTALDLGLEGTAARLRGEEGQEVLLLLRKPDGRTRELSLRRRQVNLLPVRHRRLRQDGHALGYLRITQFSEPVPAQVRQALEALQGGDGGPPIEALILDLRNNSGGLVSAGVAVADSLLDGEVIVETEDRGGIASRQQAGAGRRYGGPLLTLVNSGTASASEILAGALQDSGRSLLAGGDTFGKGLIQTLIPLGDGSGLAVTVARYLTPAGHDIQNRGIHPDEPLPAPEPLNPGGDADRWLEQAAALLIHQLEGATASDTTQAALGRP